MVIELQVNEKGAGGGGLRGIVRQKKIVYTVLMVRTIIKPDTSRVNLSIPTEYIGEELEILVFPINSTDTPPKSTNDDYTSPNRAVPVFGCLKGQIQMSDDFDEPLEDFKEYM
jgi:hypothetical protein